MWKTCYRGRPIKFRGVDINTGGFVYAQLGEIMGEINSEIPPKYLTFITDDAHVIEAESVRQLVGYDKHGNEVYEGDVLVIEHCHCKPPMNEYTVEFKVHGYKHDASVNFETNTRKDILKEVKI